MKMSWRLKLTVCVAFALTTHPAWQAKAQKAATQLAQLPPAKPLGPLTQDEVQRAQTNLSSNLQNQYVAAALASHKAVRTASGLVFHPGDTWGKPCLLHYVQQPAEACDPLGSPEANAVLAATHAGKGSAEIVINRLCIYEWGRTDSEGFKNGVSDCTLIDGPDGRPTLVNTNMLNNAIRPDPDYLATMIKALRGQVPVPAAMGSR